MLTFATLNLCFWPTAGTRVNDTGTTSSPLLLSFHVLMLTTLDLRAFGRLLAPVSTTLVPVVPLCQGFLWLRLRLELRLRLRLELRLRLWPKAGIGLGLCLGRGLGLSLFFHSVILYDNESFDFSAGIGTTSKIAQFLEVFATNRFCVFPLFHVLMFAIRSIRNVKPMRTNAIS